MYLCCDRGCATRWWIEHPLQILFKSRPSSGSVVDDGSSGCSVVVSGCSGSSGCCVVAGGSSGS